MRVPTTLVGCVVHRTAFDMQVRLSFADPDPGVHRRIDAELVIETPFRLTDAAGRRYDLEPGSGSRLGPTLDLLHRVVRTVEVGPQGALELTFGSGAVLLVGPPPEFESWHLTGTGVDGILVGPGGDTNWTP